MAKRLPELFEDLKQAFMGGESWTGKADTALRAAGDSMRGIGSDTLKTTADRFNAALPFIERAGYRVTGVDVGLGLSPRVVSHLALERRLDSDARTALLDEVRDQTFLHTVLSALFSAADTRDRLKFQDFHFTGLELELSILPTVSLKFHPDQGNQGDIEAVEDTEGGDTVALPHD